MGQHSSLLEVDGNQTVTVPECFKLRMLPKDQLLSPSMSKESVMALKKSFGSDQVPTTTLARIKTLQVKEGIWNSADDIAKAIDFWSWVVDLLKVIGPYVESLILDLFESQDRHFSALIRNTKMDFLLHLSTLLPNLTALKLTGEGISGLPPRDLTLYSRKADQIQIGLTTLLVDEGFCCGVMEEMMWTVIQSGKSTLRHLELQVDQIPIPDENIPDKSVVIFQRVTSLTLSNIANAVSVENPLMVGLCQLFPNVRKLQIRRNRGGPIPLLYKLVNMMIDECALEEIVPDPLLARKIPRGSPKIKSLQRITIDISRMPEYCYGMMNHVAKVDIVAVEGLHASGMSSHAVEEEIMSRCANVRAIEFVPEN